MSVRRDHFFYIFYAFVILSITGSVTKLDEHMVELETDERTGDNFEVDINMN